MLKPSLLELPPSYLFSTVAQKAKEALRKEQEVKAPRFTRLVNLGIGDYTAPLSAPIVAAIRACADEMGEAMIGYGAEAGDARLQQAIASYIAQQSDQVVDPSWIHIQDGAKPIFARLLSAFAPRLKLRTFSPSYPAFYDGAQAVLDQCDFASLPIDPGEHEKALELLERDPPDLFVLCSPNNPDGTFFEDRFLARLIEIAQKQRFVILHDHAYGFFTQVATLKEKRSSSLYRFKGSASCVIEIGSLSKSHGFTGIRLGWLVLPPSLPHQLSSHLGRHFACTFNGASCLAQRAALAAFTPEAMQIAKQEARKALERARDLAAIFQAKGWSIESSPFTPFVWMRPQEEGHSSWELFDRLLESYGVVSTPGVGFGLEGEGCIRLSGFAPQKEVALACERLNGALKCLT